LITPKKSKWNNSAKIEYLFDEERRAGDRRAGRAVGFVGGGFPYRKYKEGSHNQTRTPAA